MLIASGTVEVYRKPIGAETSSAAQKLLGEAGVLFSASITWIVSYNLTTAAFNRLIKDKIFMRTLGQNDVAVGNCVKAGGLQPLSKAEYFVRCWQ